jgi:hypothetical protein
LQLPHFVGVFAEFLTSEHSVSLELPWKTFALAVYFVLLSDTVTVIWNLPETSLVKPSDARVDSLLVYFL